MRHTLARPVALLALLGCFTLAACGESTESVSIPAPTTPGQVSRSERTWVDATRPTARNGDYPGATTRTLRTLIWTPETATPLPLFVMAHGFGGAPEKFDAMARSIAGAGFVVAAPAFPLTNANAPGGYTHALQDVASQPADVSFVITQLLVADGAAEDALHGHIIANDVAVLGHSLGGTTTIALTRKDCCRDARVHASMLFAAGPVDLFVNFFGTDSIVDGPPTLILHGTADKTVTYASSQLLYSQIAAPKFFVGITGAGHSDAIEATAEPLTSVQSVSERAIVAFLNAQFRGADAALSDTLAALATEGNTVDSDE